MKRQFLQRCPHRFWHGKCHQPAEFCQIHSFSEFRCMGNNGRQHPSHQPVRRLARHQFFQLFTANIQQMRVINTRRACRRTGQTAKTPVNMIAGIGRYRCRAFKQLAQHPDTSARAIALVTSNHKGWTGRRTKTAMHAFAQNGIAFADKRVSKLGFGKMGLHLVAS